MTKDQQIMELAKLDGWTFDPLVGYWRDSGGYAHGSSKPLPYLTSRDAIIPVIEKVREQTLGRSIRNHYRSFLIELWKICNPDHKFGWNSEHWIDCILANPQQLSEALLRSTGRWQETK